MPFTELENWNCAISYGVGSTSPLSPSFIFSLELARNTQVCFSYTCFSVRKLQALYKLAIAVIFS
jgi:hypothetical protein